MLFSAPTNTFQKVWKWCKVLLVLDLFILVKLRLTVAMILAVLAFFQRWTRIVLVNIDSRLILDLLVVTRPNIWSYRSSCREWRMTKSTMEMWGTKIWTLSLVFYQGPWGEKWWEIGQWNILCWFLSSVEFKMGSSTHSMDLFQSTETINIHVDFETKESSAWIEILVECGLWK